MIQLLDYFSVEKTHVMGISYGGFIAGLIAGNTPERVHDLIIADCPLTMMTHEKLDALLKRFDVKTLRELMLPTTPDGIRRLLKIAWRRPPKVPSWVLRDVHKALYSDQIEEKAQLLDAMVAKMDEPTLSLEAIQSKTLLIWGEHDAVFPLSLAHKLQKALPSKPHLKVIPKTAHAPIVEKPRAFNRLVLEFLNK
jgi:pimeloyl-ACP methyl ester carboxylesterase